MTSNAAANPATLRFDIVAGLTAAAVVRKPGKR